MKKAILSVSYGTTDPAQRACTIERVENLYRHAFPDYEICRAYTSKFVLNALHKAGERADTVTEVLDRLCAAGFDEVYVQPTHVIAGGEYDSLCEDTQTHKDCFKRLCVGKPLLDSVEDGEYICRFFAGKLETANRAVAFMGHGSVHPENEKYTLLQTTARRLGYEFLFVMTLEASPSVQEVIPMIRDAGYKNVLLTPLLFGAAGHAKRDMAGDGPDSVASILRAGGLEVECLVKGLGEYDAIADRYLEHLRRAMKE